MTKQQYLTLKAAVARIIRDEDQDVEWITANLIFGRISSLYAEEHDDPTKVFASMPVAGLLVDPRADPPQPEYVDAIRAVDEAVNDIRF
jgi:hypothetical protein